MKAEERKEIETNSLTVYIAKTKEFLSGRGGYYVIGTVALLIAIGLLWRYMSKGRVSVTDERVLRLEAADTPQKLKDYMEAEKGNIFGSIAKMHLARRALRSEGLEKIGTDEPVKRRQAAASLEEARTYFLELTTELKEKEEPAMLQEAWIGAAQAEEALVGFPKTDDGSDSRGDVNKALEYYTNAVKFFPESEGTKRYQKHLDDLTKNKDSFVAFQKAIYKKRELPPLPTFGKTDSKEPVPPVIPPDGKKTEVPPVPTPPDGKKTEVPPVPKPEVLPMVPLPKDEKDPKAKDTKPKDEKGPAPKPADPKPK
jgi:hypothetical protein